MKKVGVVVPSSNTVLEPIVSHILHPLGITTHFTRISVSRIDLSSSSQEQFILSRFTDAARLLADAEVDVIAWGGTSGGWLGADWDYHLCNEIARQTRVPVVTAMTAQLAAFKAYQTHKIGLLLPYFTDVVQPILKNFSEVGFPITKEVHLNIAETSEIAKINKLTLRSNIKLLSENTEAVSAFCTNFAVAPYVNEIEQETNTIIFDSVLVLVWAICQLLGIERSIPGWGRLLYENPLFETHQELSC